MQLLLEIQVVRFRLCSNALGGSMRLAGHQHTFAGVAFVQEKACNSESPAVPWPSNRTVSFACMHLCAQPGHLGVLLKYY